MLYWCRIDDELMINWWYIDVVDDVFIDGTNDIDDVLMVKPLISARNFCNSGIFHPSHVSSMLPKRCRAASQLQPFSHALMQLLQPQSSQFWANRTWTQQMLKNMSMTFRVRRTLHIIDELAHWVCSSLHWTLAVSWNRTVTLRVWIPKSPCSKTNCGTVIAPHFSGNKHHWNVKIYGRQGKPWNFLSLHRVYFELPISQLI